MSDFFRVRGQVRDLFGNPRQYAVVSFQPKRTTFGVNFVVPAFAESLTTGPDGFFQADLVEGDYTVSVSFSGRQQDRFALNIPEGRDGFIEVLPFGAAKVVSEGTITLSGTGPVTATFTAPSVTGSAPISVTLVATLVSDPVAVTGSDGNGTASGLELAGVQQTLTAVWTAQADVGGATTSTASVQLPAAARPLARRLTIGARDFARSDTLWLGIANAPTGPSAEDIDAIFGWVAP